MPWHVAENHSGCPDSKPWAVVKTATGEVVGCHPSKEKADAHLRALYANVKESGRTVAFTAISMAAGMLCFTPTALRFVGEMAALLALWMLASGATALTIFPALLVVVRPRFLLRGRP